jgi:hypothetical protein
LRLTLVGSKAALARDAVAVALARHLSLTVHHLLLAAAALLLLGVLLLLVRLRKGAVRHGLRLRDMRHALAAVAALLLLLLLLRIHVLLLLLLLLLLLCPARRPGRGPAAGRRAVRHAAAVAGDTSLREGRETREE